MTRQPRERRSRGLGFYLEVVLLCALAALAMLARPAHAAPPESGFQAACDSFQRALAAQGSGGSAAEAGERFEALLRAEPGDPVLLAYAGAAGAMRANDTLLPWKKMSYAEDGLAQIDQALARLRPAHDAAMRRGVPASLETRLVAASTFLRMPAFMNRGPAGARLLREVQASPLLKDAPLGFRAAVWMAAARQAVQEQHLDEARHLYGDVVQQGAPQAEEARRQLASLAP